MFGKLYIHFETDCILIIGLGLPGIVEGLKTEGIPLSTAIGYGLLTTAVLVGSRSLVRTRHYLQHISFAAAFFQAGVLVP